ncbi:MAG: hypothetical protein COB65_06085, partial [Thalassobium sp.]
MDYTCELHGAELLCTITPDRDLARPLFCFSGMAPMTATAGGQRIKGSILQVGDLLYVTAPDHVWALDARDGGARWHYFWKTRGGPHIGNRGRDGVHRIGPGEKYVALCGRGLLGG